MSGIAEADLSRIAEACFEKRMRRDIYPRAESLIREATATGDRVILASASFLVAIRPLERFLGAETSLACELEFSGGITTGRLLGQSPFGSGKKAVVARWLQKEGADPAEASFYSDSYADIPLLEFCGKPVAVNPDRILARRARRDGWEIARFG
jgi:HAD superfamily hydrolase (TIGR01490 family)